MSGFIKSYSLLFSMSILLLFAPLTSAKHSLQEYDEYVIAKMQDLDLPGLAIAIIENNKIVLQKSYGVKDTQSNDPINNDTLFRIASLSKGFTGVLTARLADLGYLDLEDPCTYHLSEQYDRLGEIQIKHLLSHTSGFYRYACDDNVYAGASNAELHQCFLKQNIICKPGKCYHYQNYIFTLIKPILETATNSSYEDLIQALIFTPLKMEHTFSNSADWEKNENKSLGHNKVNGKYTSFRSAFYYDKIMPAGGLSSSLADMTRWLQFLMSGSKSVLSEKQLAAVYEPIVDTPEELERFNSEWRKERLKKAGYGLGWRKYDYADEVVVAHTGMLKGFTSSVAFFPKYKTGIVVLANTETEVPQLLTARYLDSYLELQLKDWIEIKKQRKKKAG